MRATVVHKSDVSSPVRNRSDHVVVTSRTATQATPNETTNEYDVYFGRREHNTTSRGRPEYANNLSLSATNAVFSVFLNCAFRDNEGIFFHSVTLAVSPPRSTCEILSAEFPTVFVPLRAYAKSCTYNTIIYHSILNSSDITFTAVSNDTGENAVHRFVFSGRTRCRIIITGKDLHRTTSLLLLFFSR